MCLPACVPSAHVDAGHIISVPPCSSSPPSITRAIIARSLCVQQPYVAVAGDYLHAISRKFHCYVGDLLHLNPARAHMSDSVEAGTQMMVLVCPPESMLPFTSAAQGTSRVLTQQA